MDLYHTDLGVLCLSFVTVRFWSSLSIGGPIISHRPWGSVFVICDCTFWSSLSIGGPIISHRPWGFVFVICDSTFLLESVDRWTYNIIQILGFCVCHL